MTAGSITNPRSAVRRVARDILVMVLVAVLASFLIKTFLVRSYFIPSASMQNTLTIDDRVIVNELIPALVPVQRGDVIVFTDPGGWLAPSPSPWADPIGTIGSTLGLTPSTDNSHLIKRVIGLSGDRVVCCNALGQVSINDIPLTEPYITVPAGLPADPHSFDVVVPAEHVLVLGDNRYNSQDSAYHLAMNDPAPFVPMGNINGKAVALTWPLARVKWL